MIIIINPNDVRLDVRDFGREFYLTNIRPAYLYANGIRTEERVGTTYEVALPALSLEKIRVRVEGEQMIPDEVLENDGFQKVNFNKLEAHFYLVNNQLGIRATAEDIKLIPTKE